MGNQHTVLYAIQATAGAKFTDFGGWDMPVQFSSIIAEHEAVRHRAGLFDLCHMGRLRLNGPGALAFLDQQICRPLASMQIGQVRYGLICEADGGVIDDVLVSREAEDAFHVVVNAGNRETVVARWQAALPSNCSMEDLTLDQAMIAVQGPEAAGLLVSLGLNSEGLGNYRFRDIKRDGSTIRLSRTGYTGEDGFECFLPSTQAAAFWQEIAATGITLCGLGARDLLRLEAGMPLYGHEIDRQHSPIAAGLSFAVGKKGGYIGDEALTEEIARGSKQVLVGLNIPGKRPAREGYAVLHEGTEVGVITSGMFSPLFNAGIAMAYVLAALSSEGQALSISLRGRAEVPATVVKLPFYKRG
jgi:aminomethyltransferase